MDAASAPATAAKRRKSDRTKGQETPGSSSGEGEDNLDLISYLPDEDRIILSDHPGPARRFALPRFCLRNHYAQIDGWLRSQALTGLQEIEFGYDYDIKERRLLYPLPTSVFRFAPTLCVAIFSSCEFPNQMAPSLNFPCLEQLTLSGVTMSEDALHSMISGCPVLESLFLRGNIGVGCIRINSQLSGTSASDAGIGKATIRVMQAPILEIVGNLSFSISKLVLGTTVFQGMMAISLTTSMHTVKVLVLEPLELNLNEVVDFLKCFPCLEKLYITSSMQKSMKNAMSHNPLDPIECLELHLKKVVISNYCGMRAGVDFAKFFVLNAKVLREMIFITTKNCNDKWRANQHRRLRLDNKASPGALFTFERRCLLPIFSLLKHDPFEWSGPLEWQDEINY
ncbi:hypothetical protein BS78_02G078000 [Paspalum vaginatum]|nr:hypothetical protein BS78_02G078000 [Paspalum vaginatum]